MFTWIMLKGMSEEEINKFCAMVLICSAVAVVSVDSYSVIENTKLIKATGAYCAVQNNLKKNYNDEFYVCLEDDSIKNYRLSDARLILSKLLMNNIFNSGVVDGEYLEKEVSHVEDDLNIGIKYVRNGNDIYTLNGGDSFVILTNVVENQATGEVNICEEVVPMVDGKYTTHLDLSKGNTSEVFVISKPYSEFDEINYKVEDGEATYTLKKSK